MTVEQFMKPRFKVIATYPGSTYALGEVLAGSDYWSNFCIPHPKVFQKLEWWEEQTIDALLSIQYVAVVEYVGYWLVGDIVPVSDYIIDTKAKRLTHFLLSSNKHPVHTVIPATKEQYLKFKESNK